MEKTAVEIQNERRSAYVQEPIIEIPRAIYHRVYGELSPINRIQRDDIDRPNFVLWSMDGNKITFKPEAEAK